MIPPGGSVKKVQSRRYASSFDFHCLSLDVERWMLNVHLLTFIFRRCDVL